MSPQGQFICFLIGLVLLVVASVMHLSVKAWAFALTTIAFGVGFLVLVVNAAEAM